MNMNWSNQKSNPALRTKKGSKYILHIETNGPVNPHMIAGPNISTKPKTKSRNYLDLKYSLLFTELVVYIFKFSVHWLR